MSLVEAFSGIKDFRRAEGKRYPLIPMLIIAVMSLICGRVRYREIAAFAKANNIRFQQIFKLKSYRMPSHVTFREIIQKIRFEEVNQAFEKWAKTSVPTAEGDWFVIDGKAIASTVSDYNKSYQDFVSLVSVFSQKQGQVVKAARLHNGKGSEIHAVEHLIRVLNLEGMVFSMDALHCQKKTLNTIIESGNDYIVKVKGNQPNLIKAIKKTVETSTPVDCCITIEKNRGRSERREVFVFEPMMNIPKGWPELNRIIYVQRQVESKKGLHQTKSYYISSLESDKADYFAAGIRAHWHIENRLHYVKDVIMHEDTSGIKNVTAASNISIFRNIAINFARQQGFRSIKHAAIFFASNIKKLFKIVRT